MHDYANKMALFHDNIARKEVLGNDNGDEMVFNASVAEERCFIYFFPLCGKCNLLRR